MPSYCILSHLQGFKFNNLYKFITKIHFLENKNSKFLFNDFMFNKFVKSILTSILLTTSISVFANDECSFKGVRIGDKLSPKDLMKKLGIQKYTLNPIFLNVLENKHQELFNKYGPQSIEIEYDGIGPFCERNHCVIPNKLKVGNVPINLSILFNEEKEISSISIEFQSHSWDEIKKDLFRKYGNSWTFEKMEMGIAPFDEPKKTMMVTREILEHKSGGLNYSNSFKCEVRATNYDIIFQHGNRLGLYHGVIDIEKMSEGF